MATIVVAFDKNYLIGNQGKLPWKVPEEMANFVKVTTGHPVIMGRKTWESIPKKFRPLKGRENIVVSRKRKLKEDITPECPFHVASSVEKAIKIAETISDKEPMIIGGLEIYDYVIKNGLANKIIASLIRGEYEGDTHFPELPKEWTHKIVHYEKKFIIVEYVKV
jgi:dihydrofolate reductase